MTQVSDSPFKKFPTLASKNLVLRKIQLKDVSEIFLILSDRKVLKYFGKKPFKNIQEAKERILQTTAAFKNKEGIRWGISLKDSNKIIGTAGIWRIDRTHRRGEIGYELLPQFWGRGIMKETLSEIINFGFRHLKLHSIEANTDPENIGSCKLLESLQFQKEGYLRESFYFDGKFYDNVIYSLLSKY